MTDTDKLAALLVEYAGGSEGRLDAHHFPLLARWLTERGVVVSKGIAERGQTTPSGAESPETDTTTVEPSEAAIEAFREGANWRKEWFRRFRLDVKHGLTAAYRAQFGDP
jgi:hypothetical protein